MAALDPDGIEAPACPFLGLLGDRRTRFTFPHPGHRCWASGHQRDVDLHRQVTYCLGRQYATCDRFPGARQGVPPAAAAADAPRTPAPAARPAPVPAPASPAGRVIHVFRAGDSLARIAAAYGVTVEEIVAANDLASPPRPADGFRLVIPVGGRAAGGVPPRRGQG